MEIITGYTGKKHVTSEQDRDINIGIVGGGSYVLCTGMQMEAEVSTNNEIKIRDGVIMHQGCAASIKKNTYDSVTIISGSQGMKRIDRIVARYQRDKNTNIESLDLIAIQGNPVESNPAAPEYVTGDIQAGDYMADMPMYQIVIDGLNIVEVKKEFEMAVDLKETKRQLAELNGKIGTLELICENNTTTYKTFSGLDLNKYKYFVLICGVTGSNTRKSNATTIIPREFLQYTGTLNKHEASFAKESSNYNAAMYFVSDSAVAIKSESQYDCAWLYGAL